MSGVDKKCGSSAASVANNQVGEEHLLVSYALSLAIGGELFFLLILLL